MATSHWRGTVSSYRRPPYARIGGRAPKIMAAKVHSELAAKVHSDLRSRSGTKIIGHNPQ